MLNERNIILKFVPLITNPLPVITGVFFNGNRLCSSPPGKYIKFYDELQRQSMQGRETNHYNQKHFKIIKKLVDQFQN